MSSSNHRPKEKSGFDDVVDLGSVPPPPGVVGPDVHAARTAIAALPTTLLEELRRAKNQDGGDASRTRRQEKFELPSLAKRAASFTNEAPTRPGKEGMRLLRPLAPDVNDVPPSSPASDLASAMEALTAKDAVTEAPPPPSPPPAIVKTPPMAMPSPPIPTPAPAPQQIMTPAPAPRIATPAPSPRIITPPPAPPMVAPMASQAPVEAPRPEIRIELLVALTIVGGAGLVFALLAIANRVFSQP